MLIEEDIKTTEVSPDALEAVFEEEIVEEEEIVIFKANNDDEHDEIDIAFQANDEGYW